MERIGRISKGTLMDQIYLPKNRAGLKIGEYVLIKPLEEKEESQRRMEKLYFYGVRSLEPFKTNLIETIFQEIDNKINNYDNIIITGSFLDKGFNFHDLDILLVSKETTNITNINLLKEDLEKLTGIDMHVILLSHVSLLKGLSRDPLYQLMLSKCVARKRIITRFEPVIDYKLLDYHLLKSGLLKDNFKALTGREKYYLVRNLVAISIFLKSKKVNREEVDKVILKEFSLKNISQIKENILIEKEFLPRYTQIYKQTFNSILKGAAHEAK